MGEVIGLTTMTLDGVVTVGEWYLSEGGHDQAARELFEQSAAMLLGRKTYEGLAAYWPEQTGPWADLLNPLPKFVASRTLREPLEWGATLIEGDALDGVARLKADIDGDLVLIGCGELARGLVSAGLVDELVFWVHPVLWGVGTRPLEGDTRRLELLGSDTFDSGVTRLRYRPLGED
jgi:dihydrofolate reductase